MRSWRAGRLRGGLCLRLLEIDFVMRMSLELGYPSNDCFYLTLRAEDEQTMLYLSLFHRSFGL
jgi:hypothetical protein